MHRGTILLLAPPHRNWGSASCGTLTLRRLPGERRAPAWELLGVVELWGLETLAAASAAAIPSLSKVHQSDEVFPPALLASKVWPETLPVQGDRGRVA